MGWMIGTLEDQWLDDRADELLAEVERLVDDEAVG